MKHSTWDQEKNLASSRQDFSMMKCGLLIERTVVTQGKSDTVTVKRCVRFILNDVNVHKVSWGTKPVLIDGKRIDFPKIVRKKIITYMFHDYAEKILIRETGSGDIPFKILQRLFCPMTRKVEMQ